MLTPRSSRGRFGLRQLDGWRVLLSSVGYCSPSGICLLRHFLAYRSSWFSQYSGTLLEWHRYDLQGTSIVNGDSSNHSPGYGVRHLFTGQQWYQEFGLYDLRNRFYSSDIGRFLQPDPIGFRGDRTNLYRYCRNNPVTRADLDGTAPHPAENGGI